MSNTSFYTTDAETTVPPPLHQGDVILQCEHIFEVVTKLVMLVKEENVVNVVQGR